MNFLILIPNQFTNNSSEYVVKGSKFINPTKSNSINKPVIGCGIYSEGQLVAENVQMSRMEIAYIYKDYIGKRVYHKGKRAHAVVKTCDGKYLGLKFENNPGKVSNFDLEMCLSKGWIEIV